MLGGMLLAGAPAAAQPASTGRLLKAVLGVKKLSSSAPAAAVRAPPPGLLLMMPLPNNPDVAGVTACCWRCCETNISLSSRPSVAAVVGSLWPTHERHEHIYPSQINMELEAA
jgi:hypothetical protein